MKIGVDIDEVLFPCLKHHCKFLNKKHGLNLTEDHFYSYKWWDIYNVTREESIKDYQEFTETEEFKKIEPYPGAFEGVNELMKLGDLYVITSRPNSLKNHTGQQFTYYFPGCFEDIVFGNAFSTSGEKVSKRELCRRNGIKIMLEDIATYALEVAEDIPVILFNHPWNRDIGLTRNITRVKNWKQAVKVAGFIYP